MITTSEVNWRRLVVVRILLMIARMFTDDEKLRQELVTLGNHISFDPPLR